MNLVKKTKKDLDLLKKHLEERKNFKVYFDNDDINIEYWKYNEEDNYYHGILKNYIIGRLSIENILRAITDEDYFIKLEIEN